MDTLLLDLRYAFRALRRTPAMAVVAIVTLALGIGANTAIFSVLRGILWRPLPYEAPNNTVMLWSHWKGWDKTWVSPAEYADYEKQTQIFASVGTWTSTALTYTGEGEAERVPAGVVSASLFTTLGVAPMMGRVFTAAED